MKIHLPSLKEGVPTKVQQEYDPKHSDVEFVDLKYSEPLVMDGIVEKDRDTLTFRGHLTSKVVKICARCLKSVKDHVDQPFELFYEIKGKEDLETLNDLREVLILDHPIRFLCREECRGLCPSCGINLNVEECNCRATDRSVPLSDLKKIWISKKEKK